MIDLARNANSVCGDQKGANTRGRLTPRQWMPLADEEENDRPWMDMTAGDTVS